jgi:hypothetical protein
MNLFGLFMILIVAAAAVLCIALIGNSHQQAVVDTYGATMSNETNQSQAVAGNLTATGGQIGGGVILLVAGIIGVVVFMAFYLIATKRY